MGTITTTSVADGIPFDPNLPNQTPVNGNMVVYDAASNLWLASDNPELDILHFNRYSSHPQNTVTTLNGLLTLTVADFYTHVISGTATGFKIRLPDATTLHEGWQYKFCNQNSQPITVQYNDGSTLFVLDQTSIADLVLHDNTTSNGGWVFTQAFSGSTTGILSYNLIASTPFNTTSTTDVMITGFTITPQAGTYFIIYNGASFLTTTPKAHWWSIYKNAVKITDSERTQDTAHSNQNMVDATQTIASFNGADSCNIRVRTSNGTLTINSRSLLLLRLGS